MSLPPISWAGTVAVTTTSGGTLSFQDVAMTAAAAALTSSAGAGINVAASSQLQGSITTSAAATVQIVGDVPSAAALSISSCTLSSVLSYLVSHFFFFSLISVLCFFLFLC